MLRFLSSVPLAVLLIAALAVFSVASTLYDMPEIFQSWPFRLVAITFFINLFLCTAQLLPGLFRTLSRQPKKQNTEAWSLSTLSADEVKTALAADRFRVTSFDDQGDLWLLGRKKSLGLLGPHILHVGLLLILVGAFLSSFQAVGQMGMYEGQTHPLPAKVSDRYGQARLTVEAFTTLYDDYGALDNWETTFTLEDDRGKHEGLTTRVNAPYKGHGLTIYQMAYDNRYLIHLHASGEADGDYAIPEDQRFPVGQYTFKIVPMTQDLPLLMVYDDKDNLADQAPLYRDAAYTFPNGSGLTYLGPHSATVLQIKYDPSLPLVFTGFLVAVFGSMALLVGRYEEVRAHIPTQGPVRIRVLTKNKDRKNRLEETLGLPSRKGK